MLLKPRILTQMSAFIIFLMADTLLFANSPEETKKPLKFKGDVSLKADFTQSENKGDVEAEANIKLESKRIKGWRAEIDIEGQSDERQMRLKEAFANWATEKLRVSLGLIEKNLGLESSQNKWKRHFESLLYRKLKETGYIGEELSLSVHSPDDDWSISLGLPESKDYGLRVAYQHSINNELSAFTSGVLASDSWYQGRRQTVYAVTFALFSTPLITDARLLSFEFEVGYGVDPVASEWSQLAQGTGLTRFKLGRGGIRIRSPLMIAATPIWGLADLSLIEHSDSRHRVTAGDGGLGLLWFLDDWQLKTHIKRKVDSYRYPDYQTQRSYDWLFDMTFMVRI